MARMMVVFRPVLPLAAMTSVFVVLLGVTVSAEQAGNPALAALGATDRSAVTMRFLQGRTLRDILEMTVTDRGVVATWEEVIMPVLIGVGDETPFLTAGGCRVT